MNMKILFTIAFIFIIAGTYAQNATVSGVVTYYFNENQGNKADIGAKAYLIPSNNITLKTSSLDSLLYVKYDKHFYDDNMIMYDEYMKLYNDNKRGFMMKKFAKSMLPKADSVFKVAAIYQKKLNDYGLKDSAAFAELDRRAFEDLFVLKSQAPYSTTINGSGNYSFSLKPGDYKLVIVSSGRTGTSLTEFSGQVYRKDVSIKAENVLDVSYNFLIF